MHTIKYLNRILLAVMLLLTAASCERRSLVDMYKEKVQVELGIDWSQFNAPVPGTVTVLFYPQDGGDPIKVPSKDVNKVTTTLPAGKYDVVVFNEDKDHFDCYDISYQPTFIVKVADDATDLLPLGIATSTVEVIDNGASLEERPDVTIIIPTVYPRNIVWTCDVDVKVGGYKYVEGVSGKFTGLSAAYGLHIPAVDKQLDDWTGNDAEKEFTTTFKCLGLHESWTAQPGDNHLKLKFLLDSGEEIERDLPIGNIIEVDSTAHTLNVQVATVASEIRGGYEVDIEPWEREKVVTGVSQGNEGSTRAAVGTLDDIYSNGFKFSINWEGKEMYENAKASWNGHDFETNPQMYWPDASDRTPCFFRAVSYPGIDNAKITSTGNSAGFDYTTASQASQQQDVLVAWAKATRVPDDGILRMKFTHALTRVNFTVYVENKEENENFVWKVSSVSVKARTSGTYTYDAKSPWQATGELVDIDYLNPEQVLDIENNGSWTGDNDLMLVPQNGEDVVVTLKWCVYARNNGTLIKMSKEDATRSYTIPTTLWRPNANLRYTHLRLPNIGEKNPGGDNGDLDDNNMNEIQYKPHYPTNTL